MSDEKNPALAGTRLSSPAAALAPGMVLNNTYELESLLGQGGMGEVWKARHLRLPKSVAIKVLHATLNASGEIIARFQREAEIGARLAHPNIVHVSDFDALPDGRRYIAMDFLEGESLADRLERGRMSFAETKAVLEQTVRGLRVAHDAGVVHRDLKPDNLFLAHAPDEDPPFRVKILDFGISKIQSPNVNLTRDMAVMGTPGYMAPEQAMGKTRDLGPAADQFALATIVYEMLTGHIAFTGDTLAEVVLKVVQETPPPVRDTVPDVPAAAAAAVMRGMSKNPESRFPDVSTFHAAFTGAQPLSPVAAAATMAATEAVPAVVPATDPVPAPERRGLPAAALVAGMVAVGLGLGVGAFALTRGGDEAPGAPPAAAS
ncbi:MAG: serine/threonine-protein kinase, partial [Myxococcota bacterium]